LLAIDRSQRARIKRSESAPSKVVVDLRAHGGECRAEGAQTVITLLAPETWPTRLPGRYPNRAILWQLTLLHNGREYRYWLPIFD
jgi:hypothetical protein